MLEMQMISYSQKLLKSLTKLILSALTELAYQALGELAPITAVIGGYFAQEILKDIVPGNFIQLSNL
jgi:hypothetical protein